MNTELPEMSRHEASWHEHLAGMRATEKARKEGGNTAATNALAAATLGPVCIAGFSLHPASQGTIWTLKRVAAEFTEWADRLQMPVSENPERPGTREMLELGLTTLCFCDCQACFQDLERGRLEILIARADALIWDLPAVDLLALQAHFQTQMERLQSLGTVDDTTPKKPLEAVVSGISPATATPPEVTDSPPSNGCVPNTPSLSPMPSGARP